MRRSKGGESASLFLQKATSFLPCTEWVITSTETQSALVENYKGTHSIS